ncbi:MAG TPA: hypothetical protein VF163_13655 [Micromonosporaceae bacterium]
MFRSILRRSGRVASPTMVVLAGLCFALPFVTVSCDTPGGFGRAAPGATITYTGIDLAVGGQPDVSPPDKVRAGNGADRLPPQPAAIIVLLLLVAATGVAVARVDPRTRRASVTVLAGFAAAGALINQALVEAELRLRVAEQVSQPLPADKSVRDFVHTGTGFVVCLLLLVLVAAANALGWWRGRRGSADAANPANPELASPVDPEPASST